MLDYPIRHVLVRHEQGATHMADGYARATGKVGVAIATSGPGATNMVTGIATAMMDSSPIVCITGQVGSALIGSDAFQETDITGITLPITKHNFLVTRGERSRARDSRGVRHRRERPAGAGADRHHQGRAARRRASSTGRARRPISSRWRGRAIRAASIRWQLINAAERPLILAGHGIILGGAEAALQAFAEKAQIPVAMTLLGIGGFPASHPLNLGMMGMHGEAWVNTAIQEADLLIALGMRFDDRVTGNLKTYAPHAKKIHVDIDPAEFNKNVRVDAAISGDVGAVVRDWMPQRRRRRSLDVARRTSPTSRAIRRFATSRTCPTMAICMRRT